MKLLTSALAIALMATTTAASAQDVKLKNAVDSVSYGLGVSVGQSLAKGDFGDLNIDAMAQAIRDMMSGKEPKISAEQANELIVKHMNRKNERVASTNLEAGTKFLAENKKAKGVTELPSGLQYKILTAGDGAIPTLQDQVRVHYHGTTIDGKVFDSSVERGEPIVLPVSGVISGWTEALQLMPVGSKWTLYIPANLAYGERGASGAIGPNATLIFDVELLEIVK